MNVNFLFDDDIRFKNAFVSIPPVHPLLLFKGNGVAHYKVSLMPYTTLQPWDYTSFHPSAIAADTHRQFKTTSLQQDFFYLYQFPWDEVSPNETQAQSLLK